MTDKKKSGNEVKHTVTSRALGTLRAKTKDAKALLAKPFIALVTTPQSTKTNALVFLGTNGDRPHVDGHPNLVCFVISGLEIHAVRTMDRIRSLFTANCNMFDEGGEDFYAGQVVDRLSRFAASSLESLKEPRACTAEIMVVDVFNTRPVFTVNFAGHCTQRSLFLADGKVYDGDGEVSELTPAPADSDANKPTVGPDAAQDTPTVAPPDIVESLSPDACDSNCSECGECSSSDPNPEGEASPEDQRAKFIEALRRAGVSVDDEASRRGTIILLGCYDKKLRTEIIEILTRNIVNSKGTMEDAVKTRKELQEASGLRLVALAPI